jgi:hypothetical protein
MVFPKRAALEVGSTVSMRRCEGPASLPAAFKLAGVIEFASDLP